MSHDLFISHESDSLPFVEEVAKVFESNGVRCWYAPRDLDQSSAGKEYDDELVQAIHDASAIVVILNDPALKSIWVKREVSQAEKQGKMIFPFVISELTINNGLLMRLEDKHLINAYPNPASKLPVLLNNVRQLMGKQTLRIDSVIVDDNTKNRQERLKNFFDFDYDEGIAFLEVEEDQQAFMAFLRSAENGSVKAQEQLSKILFRHNSDSSFLDERTWEHIEELSDSGEAFADLLMHFKYFAMGTQHEISMKYLKRALSKQASPYALLQMGICYGWGLGVNVSDVLQMLYYKKAYDAGCDDAISYIGQLYMNGGIKIRKNLTKAEEFLKEGAEKGVARCYEKLCHLYSSKKEYDQALDILKHMVDNNIEGAYSLMGDYYEILAPEKDRDSSKAEHWYKQAVKHNEKGAYGSLAYKYWRDGGEQEAYRIAKKGCLENDSYSYFFLGYFYEQDEDYQKAWDCYHQRVLKYGSDASPMANLYIHKDYLPEDYALYQLKQLLVIDAKLQRYNSIICLLQIILKEHGKNLDVTYDALRDIPESYEYIRMGAECPDQAVDNAELMYIYGRLQIEEGGKLHNLYQGIEMISLASERGNISATEYALNDRWNFELSDIANNAIHFKMYPIEHIRTIIDYGKNKCGTEELKSWIHGAKAVLQERNDLFAARYYLYHWQMELLNNLEECDLEEIKNDIEVNKEALAISGCLSALKEHIVDIFPSYNPQKVIDGDLNDDNNVFLFYCINFTRFSVASTTNHEFELKISKLLCVDDVRIEGNSALAKDDVAFCKVYHDMLDAYYHLIDEKKAKPMNEDLKMDITEFVPVCPSRLVLHYCQLCLKMLISSREAFAEKWTDIVTHLDDDNYLLDIAETIKDDDNAISLLVGIVENRFESDGIFLENEIFRTACKNKDRKLVSKELNKYMDKLDKLKIRHREERFTEDNIPESLFDI